MGKQDNLDAIFEEMLEGKYKSDEDKNEKKQTTIDVSLLKPYPNHQFNLYENDAMNSLVQSIKSIGILHPVVITKKNDEYYILAGHNRVAAARKIGIKEVPVVIKENLSPEQEQYIMTVSNLIQRSFKNLSYKERVAAVKMYSDSREKIEKEFLSNDRIINKKIKEKMKEDTGFTVRTINQYLRLNNLDEYYIDLLDQKKITFILCYKLSFLPVDILLKLKQLHQDGLVTLNKREIDILKKSDEDRNLNTENILEVIAVKPKKRNGWKMSENFAEKYFTNGETAKEIKNIVKMALDQYFSK